MASRFPMRDRAREANEAQRALHAAASARKAHPGVAKFEAEWSAAAARFHQAVERAYPALFWEAFRRLREGAADDVDVAIRFLEEDPYFFGSGYVKGNLIRSLKKLALSEEQAERLRRVIVVVIDKGDRPRLREYCRLARAVDAPSLRTALASRANGEDKGIARRARWVLDACAQLPQSSASRSD